VRQDGSIDVAGQKEYSAWVCCLGANGSVLWSRKFDGDKVVTLSQSADNGVVAACVSSNTSRSSINMTWIDGNGNLLVKGPTVECPAKNANIPIVLPLINLNTVFAAVNTCNGKCQVMSYDPKASPIWKQEIAVPDSEMMRLSSFVHAGPQGYIGAGVLSEARTGLDHAMWMARIENTGVVAWQWSSESAQGALCVAPAGKNDFIVLATCLYARTSLILIKVSAPPQEVAVRMTAPRQSGLQQHATNGTAIFDVQGRLVSSHGFGNRLPCGMFFRKNSDVSQAATPFQSVHR
jgi:hypothetical protein